jgi:hypothetical protein
MQQYGKELVMAEVLLRRPDPSVANKVARFLQEQGIAVSSIGAASVSIYSDQDHFEHVFQTSLKRSIPGNLPQEVYDFGPLEHAAFEVKPPSEIQIPDPIANEVEGIYLQQPARLF